MEIPGGIKVGIASWATVGHGLWPCYGLATRDTMNPIILVVYTSRELSYLYMLVTCSIGHTSHQSLILYTVARLDTRWRDIEDGNGLPVTLSPTRMNQESNLSIEEKSIFQIEEELNSKLSCSSKSSKMAAKMSSCSKMKMQGVV